jgi:predicted kinase
MTLVIMVGISGSGKSTKSEEFKKMGYEILSSDEIRLSLGDVNDQTKNGMVFGILRHKLISCLSNNRDVVVDATSLNPRERKDYILAGKRYSAKVVAYVLERDKATVMKNQSKRKASGGREVPEFVIDKMIAKYVRPSTSEGFDEVILV